MIKLKIIPVFLFLFLTFPVYSYGKDENLKKFSDPKGRYNLSLPKGWEEYTEEGETIFTIFQDDKNFATCYIFGFPVEQGMTLQNMVSWTLRGFQQGGEGYNFKIRGKDKVSICGVEAVLVKQQEHYKEKDFEEIIWIDEYFFIKGGQGIILHFDTSKEAYDKFQGDFKSIAGSFTFGKKQFSPIIDEKLNPIPHKNK